MQPAQARLGSEPTVQPGPIEIRIVRGPLPPFENEAILTHYNRLTSSRIPITEFMRWVQESPDGPAWHAVLETQDAGIVGHSSLIPLRGTVDGGQVIAAKSEYSFLLEEFRTQKIRGIEDSGAFRNFVVIDRLFRHCRAQGWGPLLISTDPAVHRLYRRLGCIPVKFPVRENLFVLKPREAARETPNLSNSRRTLLRVGGAIQKSLATSVRIGRSASSQINASQGSLNDWQPAGELGRLSLFADRDSLHWRYPSPEYQRLRWDARSDGWVVVKNGSSDRFLRVCQYHAGTETPSRELIRALLRLAFSQNALGVRWAVPLRNARDEKLANRLALAGFISARRERTLLVQSGDARFLRPDSWDIPDSFFSFDP